MKVKTKILVVDDYEENIRLLSHIISFDDVEIHSATNADDALELILEYEFGLALLDVQMPNISGFDLARLIRGVKRYQNLPIIFVTAHQRDQKFLSEGYETGAVDVLFKPLDVDVVRSKVRVFVQLDQQSRLLKSQMEELESLKSRAESANLAKGQFLSNMSHEIRTPLTAVMGFADVLSSGDFTRFNKDECVEAIKRNGQLLLRLINDILDFSKIEARGLVLERQNFILKDLIEDVYSALLPVAKQKSVDLLLTFDKAAANRQFSADSLRIKQILFNLVGNAIKFTKEGHVSLKVELLSGLNGQTQISFYIADTGLGLTPEQSKNLFKPFTQGDPSTRRQFGGTGLGLVISQQIAQAMNGDIRLLSTQLDQGSTFLAQIKVDPPEMKAASPQSPQGHFKNLRDLKDIEEKRILVVDDSIDNRTLIDFYLEPFGFKLSFAENGHQAINKVQELDHDLILMDIQMPLMDGLEATEKIRALGFSKPIIALTAHVMSEEKDRCMKAGCDMVLSKPIQMEEFLEGIHRSFQSI